MTKELNVEEIKSFFLKESSFTEHYELQKSQSDLYSSVLILLLQQGVDLSVGTKARILASSWARQDIDLADYLVNGLRYGKKSTNDDANLLAKDDSSSTTESTEQSAQQHTYVFGLVEVILRIEIDQLIV